MTSSKTTLIDASVKPKEVDMSSQDLDDMFADAVDGLRRQGALVDALRRRIARGKYIHSRKGVYLRQHVRGRCALTSENLRAISRTCAQVLLPENLRRNLDVWSDAGSEIWIPGESVA